MDQGAVEARNALFTALHQAGMEDEAVASARLASRLPFSFSDRANILAEGRRLAARARIQNPALLDIDSLLAEYRLSSPEGVILLCLAEALLRIPDDATRDALIKDKLARGHWEEHKGHSTSALVNASTWGLMLGAGIVRAGSDQAASLLGAIASRLGEPLLRKALLGAMAVLGHQFVMGRTIPEALERGNGRLSFDMLGEAARTRPDANAYRRAYAGAIDAVGAASAGRGPVEGPGVSVKLSALHPRYEPAKRDQVMAELCPVLLDLCRSAKSHDIGLTLDAEESWRLPLSLELAATVITDPSLRGWEGFGLAVQAYQKRAHHVLDWLEEMASAHGRRLMVRLVKGAYWDSEIKRAQVQGLEAYPVFTAKAATDVSWLAGAARILAAGPRLFGQFATHNAHSAAAILHLAQGRRDWEFQRLHGMGESLYQALDRAQPVRVYAPVGSHRDLLPYLVRRLLENGANASFVNRLSHAELSVEQVVRDPVEELTSQQPMPLPAGIFAPRRNSTGLDLADPVVAEATLKGLATLSASPQPPISAQNPGEAVRRARNAFPAWNRIGGARRAEILELAADLFEGQRLFFMNLLIHEAAKTIPDALAEVRETVDFLRHYAALARETFGPARVLPGPVGESNILQLEGLGVFACIAPWNFPLAIFTGQVAAALAAGNSVVAKPAPQTPAVAQAAVRLLRQAGIPDDVLILVPGDGRVGEILVREKDIAGVSFTGSLATARRIQRVLAGRDGAIVRLVAETGGVNALVADSSALTDQLCADVMESAFHSCGQRCSAARLLLVQEDAWITLEPVLVGALAELKLGDPAFLETDIGPLIDAGARARLTEHDQILAARTRLVTRAPSPAPQEGAWFAPSVYELPPGTVPTEELFGPILQVMVWNSSTLDGLLDKLAATGWGLTLGIHSRTESLAERVRSRLRAGNIYINRAMIGAVVGSQPFGGLGLSGTGPKAGGPHSLLAYATEICVSVNSAAVGGDVALLGSQDV